MNKETDKNHIWHPYTSISHPRPVDAVASTSGTHIYLPGVMSRKKQVIPPLSEAVKRLGKN